MLTELLFSFHVPTVDSTFPIPVLSLNFSANSASSEDWASTIFALAIILDFRVPKITEEQSPYFFAPTNAVVLPVLQVLRSLLVPSMEVCPTSSASSEHDENDSFFVPDPFRAESATDPKNGLKKELEKLPMFKMTGEAKKNMKIDPLAMWKNIKIFFQFFIQ